MQAQDVSKSGGLCPHCGHVIEKAIGKHLARCRIASVEEREAWARDHRWPEQPHHVGRSNAESERAALLRGWGRPSS